ncbi:MAG: prephenate dehydratase [Polyangiales bacterium]
MMEVAYQGVPGAFAEEAAEQLVPDLPRAPKARLEDVFAAIAEGHYGVVPIENSLAGSVAAVADRLATGEAQIVAEKSLRISHALVAAAGTKLASVRRVYSHPVALAQCERFFDAHPEITPIAAYNTAGAIADVIARKAPDEAAIGSLRAAAAHGGVVLATQLEDDPENFTRFLLLAREPRPSKGPRKASMVFGLPHRAGSLVSALAVFSARGLSLTKIESHPLRGRPFEYLFHADVAFDDDALLDDALAELGALTLGLRVLGRY